MGDDALGAMRGGAVVKQFVEFFCKAVLKSMWEASSIGLALYATAFRAARSVELIE